MDGFMEVVIIVVLLTTFPNKLWGFSTFICSFHADKVYYNNTCAMTGVLQYYHYWRNKLRNTDLIGLAESSYHSQPQF